MLLGRPIPRGERSLNLPRILRHVALLGGLFWVGSALMCGGDDGASSGDGNGVIPNAWGGIWSIDSRFTDCVTQAPVDSAQGLTQLFCPGKQLELDLGEVGTQLTCTGTFTDTDLDLTCTGTQATNVGVVDISAGLHGTRSADHFDGFTSASVLSWQIRLLRGASSPVMSF